jgi:hypothetical protein
MLDRLLILFAIIIIGQLIYLISKSIKECKKEEEEAKSHGCTCKWNKLWFTMDPSCPYPEHKKFIEFWAAKFKLGQKVRSIHPISNWPPDKIGTIERVIHSDNGYSYDVMLYDVPPEIANLKNREDAIRLLGPYRGIKHEIWGGAPSLILMEVREEDLCLIKYRSAARSAGMNLPFFRSRVSDADRTNKK